MPPESATSTASGSLNLVQFPVHDQPAESQSAGFDLGRGLQSTLELNEQLGLIKRWLQSSLNVDGVRYVHTHDDVQYHLFIPTSAGMEFELDGEKPAPMAAWQAQFVKGGTRHGFKNKSQSTVTIMEIFVKK